MPVYFYKTISVIGATLLFGSAAITSAAVYTTDAALVSHPGKLLASNCFQCHGTNGRSGAFDSLAGKSSSEITKELYEMRQTRESDKALMKVHALGYSDLQIQQLADYFYRLKK